MVAVVATASLPSALLVLVQACIGPEAATEAPSEAGAEAEASGDDSPGDAGSPFTIVIGPPSGETLTAVWGADHENIFAVGNNGVIYSYFQGQWKRTQEFRGWDLEALWGRSINDVYAVGLDTGTGGGVVLHFDGSAWSNEFKTPVPLYGVWGDANGDSVIAVGAQGMIYGLHPNVSPWTMVQGLPANPKAPYDPSIQSQEPLLWSIAGTSIDDFAMPADVDRVFHMTTGFNVVTLDPTVDRSIAFRSVFCIPTNPPTYLFGTNYFGLVWLSTDPLGDSSLIGGSLWQIFSDHSPGTDNLYIYGIWGAGTRYLFTGDQGRIYSLDTGPQTVTQVRSPTTSTLYGAWGSSSSDVWIVGQQEVILHGALPGP
jgi:hypothetical protein